MAFLAELAMMFGSTVIWGTILISLHLLNLNVQRISVNPSFASHMSRMHYKHTSTYCSLLMSRYNVAGNWQTYDL